VVAFLALAMQLCMPSWPAPRARPVRLSFTGKARAPARPAALVVLATARAGAARDAAPRHLLALALRSAPGAA